MKRSTPYLFFLLALYACIGTDILDEVPLIERLFIDQQASNIMVGDQFNFTARYQSREGEQVITETTWNSSNPSIISIDSKGKAEAHAEGEVTIEVVFKNLTDKVQVTASQENTGSENKLSGQFGGRNGYSVQGTVSLVSEDATLYLTLEEDFSATNGPGLYIYLSNDSDGVSNGIEVSSLMQNSGMQTYQVPAGVSLRQYSYVYIYCKPFGVPFGVANLQK